MTNLEMFCKMLKSSKIEFKKYVEAEEDGLVRIVLKSGSENVVGYCGAMADFVFDLNGNLKHVEVGET